MSHYLKPINNNAVLEMLEKEKISAGGILLTQNDPKEVTKGRVVAVGINCVEVKVGDIVLPNWNAAKKNELNDETFFVVSEDEIILVFEP
jgi:co-chaperonin GroES (HSP10)